MKYNNEFLKGLVNYLNEKYTHDTDRHFRILTADEMKKYSDALNDSDNYWYRPYATDGIEIVSVYDGLFESNTNFIFTYIGSIEEDLTNEK